MLSQIQKLFPVAETPEQREARRRFLEEFRETFAGKRAFVIGNGPSLRAEDLNRIKDEVSFGANLISLLFPLTAWRPQLISVTDPLVWAKAPLEQVSETIPWLVDSSFSGRGLSRTIIPFRRFARLSSEYYSTRLAGQAFSPDVARGFFGGYSVTFFNLQLAFTLGLNPVYLLGVDHHYRHNRSRYFSSAGRVENVVDHFHPDYRQKGELVNSAPVRAIERSMSSLEQVRRETGFRVVDLTRGGRMPGVERTPFDDIVP